jgi:hypothetical protein
MGTSRAEIEELLALKSANVQRLQVHQLRQLESAQPRPRHRPYPSYLLHPHLLTARADPRGVPLVRR